MHAVWRTRRGSERQMHGVCGAARRCTYITTWTIFQQDGPNHLGLSNLFRFEWTEALPGAGGPDGAAVGLVAGAVRHRLCFALPLPFAAETLPLPCVFHCLHG